MVSQFSRYYKSLFSFISYSERHNNMYQSIDGDSELTEMEVNG